MARGVPIYGEVLAELRRRALKSQFELAADCQAYDRHCGLTRDRISDYETERRAPSLRNLLVLIAVLKLTPAEQQALIRTPTLDERLGYLNGNGNGTNRGQFLKAILGGLASAAVAPLDAVEHITHAGGRPVDSKLINDHEDLADWLAGRHPAIRPDVLIDLVAKDADTLLGLLGRSMPSAERSRLEAVAVSVCAQAGLLNFGAGDRIAAWKWFATARSVAADAGDDTLIAQACAVASILYSSIPTGRRRDDARRAVELLSGAVERARRADPHTRAWIHWWLAEELAATGDERGFAEAIGTTERLSSRTTGHQGRGFFARTYTTSPEQVSKSTGVGLVLLEHAEQGMEPLNGALALPGTASKVIVLTAIASGRVLQGEPEAACQGLGRGLDLALDRSYVQGIERILGVRARFPAKWSLLACVRELDEQLRLVA